MIATYMTPNVCTNDTEFSFSSLPSPARPSLSMWCSFLSTTSLSKDHRWELEVNTLPAQQEKA